MVTGLLVQCLLGLRSTYAETALDPITAMRRATRMRRETLIAHLHSPAGNAPIARACSGRDRRRPSVAAACRRASWPDSTRRGRIAEPHLAGHSVWPA